MPSPISEEDVLIPRPNNEDLWAEYELSSVLVHAPGDSSTPTSLLHASIGNPLTVTGQLEPIDEDDAHLLVPGVTHTNKRINLELTDVCTFSYGELGDGSIAVWAGGKAGWFKIKPGRAYREVYGEMQEAVKLLYFVADSYKEKRKEKGGGRGKKSVQLPPYSPLELAGKYAAEVLGSEDADEGFEKFEEHRKFLIASMLAGKENLEWSTYPLWNDMHEKFPEVFKEMRKRLNAKPTKTKPKKTSTTAPTKSKRGRPRKDDQASTTSSSTTAPSSKRQQPPSETPVDIISLSDTESSEEIKDSLVQAASDEPSDSPKSRFKHPPKSRRTRHNNNHIESTPILTPSREDDSDDDEARIRNKSSLRPRASKGNKGNKGRPREEEVEDEEDEETPASSPTQKRKQPYEDQRPNKRRSSDSSSVAEEDDEGIDIPASPQPDPLQENVWLCALSGCTHKIYASHTPTSQVLIREHYVLHAYDDDERIQMVKRLAQPSLPIGRLMAKVRDVARGEGFPGSVPTVAVSRFGEGVGTRY